VKDSYNFQAIAKKIVAVLEQEKVPIILTPKVFEAVNDDIFEHTIPSFGRVNEGEKVKKSNKSPKPTVTENSCMGGPRDLLQASAEIVASILKYINGDNFKLAIEVSNGTFVINKYPMESANTPENSVGIMYTRPSQPEGKSETLKITFGNGRVERLEFTYEKETAPGKVEILTEAAEVYQQVLDGRNIAKDSVTKEQLDETFTL